MGRHTGERTSQERASAQSSYAAPTPPRRAIIVLALLVAGTLVAWGVLVYSAIDFGGEARSGEPSAWAFLVLATLGAAACLFVTLLLGARIVTLAQGRQAPTRPQGGHRAQR